MGTAVSVPPLGQEVKRQRRTTTTTTEKLGRRDFVFIRNIVNKNLAINSPTFTNDMRVERMQRRGTRAAAAKGTRALVVFDDAWDSRTTAVNEDARAHGRSLG